MTLLRVCGSEFTLLHQEGNAANVWLGMWCNNNYLWQFENVELTYITMVISLFRSSPVILLHFYYNKPNDFKHNNDAVNQIMYSSLSVVYMYHMSKTTERVLFIEGQQSSRIIRKFIVFYTPK